MQHKIISNTNKIQLIFDKVEDYQDVLRIFIKKIKKRIIEFIWNKKNLNRPEDLAKMPLKKYLSLYPECRNGFLAYLAKVESGEKCSKKPMEELAKYLINNTLKLNRLQKMILVKLVQTIEMQRKYKKYIPCDIETNGTKELKLGPVMMIVNNYYNNELKWLLGASRDEFRLAWGSYKNHIFLNFISTQKQLNVDFDGATLT
ncbi:hypothetical protein ACFL5G_02420 [Candidatus Margulisiibacteriota bacterium]